MPTPDPRCGTPSGRQRHYYLREKPCAPCREASNAARRARRAATPIRELKPCGTNAAYLRHLRRGETPCDPCCEARRVAHSGYNHGDVVETRAANPPGDPTRPECGTRQGYQRHVSRREPTCQPCRDAHNAYDRALAAAAHPPCGTRDAARSHSARGETCQTCRVDGRAGRTVSKPHGTTAAVRRHEYQREPCCEQCLPVQRQLLRDRRARAKQRRSRGVPDPT